MFGDNKSLSETNFDTLVGEKTTIRGDIIFAGGLHIDGRVEGSIKAEQAEDGLLVISERGVVDGEVDVPSVVIDGRLTGDLTARNRVELREHARIDGNIRYGAIRMELGAQVNGKLESDVKPSQPAAPKPAQSSQPEPKKSGPGGK